MKKSNLFCLTAIVMLTLTACTSKAEGPPENNSPTPTMTPDSVEGLDNLTTLTPEPTKHPVDNKTVKEHQELAEKIYQAVKDNCTYHAEMMVQDDETYMNDVLGLDPSWYNVAIVEIPMISTNVDMFALIHPTEGNFEKVEAAIKNYQDFLVNDSFQYPMNVGKVRNCKAAAIGDYVFFILLDFPDNAIKVIEEVLEEESK